jgi:hypothetical protein
MRLSSPSFLRHILIANRKAQSLFTMKRETIYSSEKSVFTTATRRRHIPEDSILYSPTSYDTKTLLDGAASLKFHFLALQQED